MTLKIYIENKKVCVEYFPDNGIEDEIELRKEYIIADVEPQRNK